MERKTLQAARIGQLIGISVTITDLKAREEWISSLVEMLQNYDNWGNYEMNENDIALEHLREAVHANDIAKGNIGSVFPVESIMTNTQSAAPVKKTTPIT